MNIIALLTIIVFTAPAPTLIVVDETAGQTVFCHQLDSGEHFSLAFTNSMYGGDVRETYVVTSEGMIRRLTMHTEHPAAADYYAYTVDVVREGDWYRVEAPPAEFAEIAVRIDEVGAPRLNIADQEFPLLTATGNQHRVVLRGHVTSRLSGNEC
jgi:hypothetical protein